MHKRNLGAVVATFSVAMWGFIVVHSAAGGTFDITGYGAKAGDGTSDSAAIQSAVSAAKSGDTIFVPAGAFTIDKTITLKSGVTFAGAGASSVLSFSGSGASMLKMSGLSNVQVASLTFDGGSSSIGQGINADNSSSLNIRNVQVKNIGGNADFGPHGIYFSSNVTNSKVTSSSISDIGKSREWGAGIRVAWGSTGNTLAGNTIANTGRGGILADDGASNLTIRNNTISGSGLSGINGTGLGIEVWRSPKALIQDNAVDHWISVDASDGSAVRGNRISDTSGRNELAGLELVASNDVIFSRNTVDGGAVMGISESNNGTQSTARTYLAHNTIKSSSAWGIQLLGGPGAGTKQQYFYGNAFTNTAGGKGHGFRFNGNAHFIVLDNNTIANNGGAAIEFTGTNVNHLVFKRNALKNNSGPTLTSAFNGTDVVWTGNTVAGNASGTNAPSNTGSAANLPTISLNAPATIAPGETAVLSVAFTPGATGSTLANTLWDFDDGLPVATSGNVTGASFKYASPGTYTIGVVAWDADGRAAHAETSIIVGNVPEPAIGLFASSVVLLLSRRTRGESGVIRSSCLEME